MGQLCVPDHAGKLAGFTAARRRRSCNDAQCARPALCGRRRGRLAGFDAPFRPAKARLPNYPFQRERFWFNDAIRGPTSRTQADSINERRPWRARARHACRQPVIRRIRGLLHEIVWRPAKMLARRQDGAGPCAQDRRCGERRRPSPRMLISPLRSIAFQASISSRPCEAWLVDGARRHGQTRPCARVLAFSPAMSACSHACSQFSKRTACWSEAAMFCVSCRRRPPMIRTISRTAPASRASRLRRRIDADQPLRRLPWRTCCAAMSIRSTCSSLAAPWMTRNGFTRPRLPARFYNSLWPMLSAPCAEASGGRPLRIIEVGAGTGQHHGVRPVAAGELALRVHFHRRFAPLPQSRPREVRGF